MPGLSSQIRRLEHFAQDLQVLTRLLRGMPGHRVHRGHAQRLQLFYAPQAGHYDAFRDRLLPGRSEMIKRLCAGPGARIVELGAGTGRNLAFFGDALPGFGSVELVDLCPALLERARALAAPLPNVHVVEADATRYRPAGAVDCVYFAFSLTMIPDWRAALDSAVAMLKPGGRLGIVDFHIPARFERCGSGAQSVLDHWFWPNWFRHDGVHLSPEHLPSAGALLPDHDVSLDRAPVPYLPGLRVPYYIFVGTKSRSGS